MQTSIQLRPFYDIEIPNWVYFYRKINFLWWLQRTPMFLLAIPAAYAVGGFSNIDDKLPMFISVMAGLAFESTYIGTIALGDQMTKNDRIGRVIWFVLNIAAVAASALFSTLYFAGGKYSDITPESITHGALLPVVNFFYGFLLHWISSQANTKAIEDEELTKVHCEYCNTGKPSQQAVWSHYRSCPVKLAGNAKKFTPEGKPLI
jgi:hypothetical protein